jgi:thiamine biosynthesis lipoprotein
MTELADSLASVRLALGAMGTRFELLLHGDDPVFLRAAGEEALAEIERLEGQLSRFRPDSEISGINATAADRPVAVEPRLFGLLQRVERLWQATGGAFDPTIGPLMARWHADRTPASPEVLNEARKRIGWQHVRLDPEARTIHFLRPEMSLDLGAIGKGYAVERAVQLLAEAGVASALLHGGTSTVYALGAPPGSRGWSVAVRDPRDGETGSDSRHLARVRLRDQALSVSAPHGRSWVLHGVRYGHVLDPRRGEPVRGALLAALVTHSAADGDALSTALLVLGAAGTASVEAWDPRCRGLVAEAAGPGHLIVTRVGAPGPEIEICESVS